MKKIYILLMHTKTIPSKVIKFVTKYEYSHVAISLEKECNTIYSFGRKNVNSIIDSGFSIENKNGDFFKKFNQTQSCIYEVEVTDENFNKISYFINMMVKEHKKYKYDYLGIILRLSGRPYIRKDKYVCSFFVAELLEKSDIYKFNKATCLVKPKDFANINKFKKVYSGEYLKY